MLSAWLNKTFLSLSLLAVVSDFKLTKYGTEMLHSTQQTHSNLFILMKEGSVLFTHFIYGYMASDTW